MRRSRAKKFGFTLAGIVAISVITWTTLRENPETYHRRELLRLESVIAATPGVSGPMSMFNRDKERANVRTFNSHRDALEEPGAVKHIVARLHQIREDTPEYKHLSDTLLFSHEDESPVPHFIGNCYWSDRQGGLELKVWYYAEHHQQWQTFLKSRNVADYRPRFTVGAATE